MEIQTDVVVVLVVVVKRSRGAVQIRKTCGILITGFHFHLRSVQGIKNTGSILT